MTLAKPIIMTPKIKYYFSIYYYPLEDVNLCWLWKGSLFVNGYARISIMEDGVKVTYRASRISYMLHHGLNMLEDDFVLHKCLNGGNPACVNPYHLVLGTQLENVKDRQKGSKALIGEGHGMSILTEDDVRAIRLEYAQGNTTYKTLALKYNVTSTNIRRVINYELWRHVL